MRVIMKNQWLMIKQLDQVLKDWQTVAKKYGRRPKTGWVKAIRTALSMSAEQLANRLGLSRARITQLEHAEINDAVTLRTLKETAEALGCELVYAIVPKNNSSLENIIKTRAKLMAKERVARVAHTMLLENQAVNKDVLNERVNEQTKILTERLNKKFWAEPTKSKKK